MGPRPRSGGISMPVATIGLFAMAIVVVLIAIVISNLAGGDDDDNQPGVFDRTPTEQADGDPTQAGGGGALTPGPTEQGGTGDATATPGGEETPAPGGGEGTYTVEAGDFCSTIAEAHDLTLDQFFELNPDIDPACTNLNVGDVVNVAP